MDSLMSLVDLDAGAGLDEEWEEEELGEEEGEESYSFGETSEEINEIPDLDDDDFDLLDEGVQDTLTQQDDVNLEAIDLNNAYLAKQTEEVEYPSILIYGLDTEEEFEFFQKRKADENVALPLYCEIEDCKVRVGDIPLDLDSMLQLRFIADYKLVLMKSENDFVEIDLDNPEVLQKFIKF